MSARSKTRCILAANCSITSPFRHNSSDAKVAELKKTLRGEQVAKECKGCSHRNIASNERRLWKRGGGWKGGRGCRTITSTTSASACRRVSRCVCFVAFARKVVQISQQTRKVTGGVSVICPNYRKRLTFVGQDACPCCWLATCASWKAECLDEWPTLRRNIQQPLS